MTNPTFDEEAVRRALEHLRQAERLTENPLSALIWVRQHADAHHPILSAVGVEVALWNALTGLIERHLTHLRRVEGLPAPDADEREVAMRALRADFAQSNTELEAWSALYYRYVRIDLDLQVQTIARELRTSVRQIQRRISHGVRRLTEQISQLESEARARERQLSLRLKLPPASYASLFGHEELLARLCSVAHMVGPPHTTILVGPGGIGKSSLAHAAVQQLVEESLLNDLAWLHLNGPTAYPALLSDLAQALGYAHLVASGPTQIEASLRNQLEHTRTLLVIDNADSLEAKDLMIPSLDRLVKPGQALLISRREPVLSTPYHLLQVPPLSREALSDLLQEIVRLRRLSRTRLLDDRSIDAIYRATGGNPLAAKLVASQLAYLPLERVLENIAGLETAEGEALFDALFAPAWADLDEAARRTALVLSLLPEGAVWLQLQAVTSLPSDALDQALRALVMRSLVDATGDQPCYQMHPLTRHFVGIQAEDPPWDAICRELLRATVAYKIAEPQPEPGAALSSAGPHGDPGTLLALLQRQIAVGEPAELITRTITGIAPTLRRTGQWARWRNLLQEVVERLEHEEGATELRASALMELGVALRWLGEHGDARVALQETVDLFGQVGDFRAQAEALIELGQLHQSLGLTDPAFETYQRAASVAHRYEISSLRRRALNGLAGLALNNLRFKQALELLEQSLETSGDEPPGGQTLHLLGAAHLGMGHVEEATRYQQAAVDTFRAEADYPRQARALLHLGMAHYAARRSEEAMDALNQALNLMRPLGDALGQARLLTNLGALYVERDRWQEALDTWRDALSLQNFLEDRVGAAYTLYNLADLAWRMGRLEEAHRDFEAAHMLAQHLSLAPLLRQLEQHPFSLQQ